MTVKGHLRAGRAISEPERQVGQEGPCHLPVPCGLGEIPQSIRRTATSTTSEVTSSRISSRAPRETPGWDRLLGQVAVKAATPDRGRHSLGKTAPGHSGPGEPGIRKRRRPRRACARLFRARRPEVRAELGNLGSRSRKSSRGRKGATRIPLRMVGGPGRPPSPGRARPRPLTNASPARVRGKSFADGLVDSALPSRRRPQNAPGSPGRRGNPG